MTIEEILDTPPFVLGHERKKEVFVPAMAAAVNWHYKQSVPFRSLCDVTGVDTQNFALEELPYFPTTVFKDHDLISVDKEEIIKVLHSSSTTGQPSKIYLDEDTSRRQGKALRQILADFFGQERMDFIILDSESVIEESAGSLNSRGTAIRGLLPMARKISFVLDKDLKVDPDKLEKALVESGNKICIFGFTWLLYLICREESQAVLLQEGFSRIADKEKLVLHIGGWKKLQEKSVSKNAFGDLMGKVFGVSPKGVIDMYGITEQLGTVYPDCSYGRKHVPLYAEVFIRDITSLRTVENGTSGFMQFMSFIPNSYPGISLLSDDIGKILGEDDCPCGRKGKYFVFDRRADTAEVKGCGDAIPIVI